MPVLGGERVRFVGESQEDTIRENMGMSMVYKITLSLMVLLFAGCGLVDDRSDSATLSPVNGVASSGWLRADIGEATDEAGGRVTINAVVVGGPGLVAVGTVTSSTRDSDGAVWTSSDGLVWSRVPHDEGVFGGDGSQQIRSIAVGGPGLVAVGLAESDVGNDASVWLSADGLVWIRVPHDESVFGGERDQGMFDVVAVDPGLVAVGYQATDAAVWTSVDGTIWSRVPHDEAVFGGEGQSRMYSVVRSGHRLVAAGTSEVHSAVWMSDDGAVWSLVKVSEHGILWDITTGGPGLIAVGGVVDGAVWTSSQGNSWSSVQETASFRLDDVRFCCVSAGDHGVFAAGNVDGDAAVWASLDGDSWARDESFVFRESSEAYISGIVAFGSVVVVVGSVGLFESDAAIWVGFSEGGQP